MNNELLTNSKNQTFKNMIISHVSDMVNHLYVNSWINMNNEAVFAMWGISWLDGFDGFDLMEDLENGKFEGGIFEDLIEGDEDGIDFGDAVDAKDLRREIKSIEDHCWPGDVCVLDSHGGYKQIEPNEVKQIFKTFKSNINKSNFTVNDYRRYCANVDDLTGLIG